MPTPPPPPPPTHRRVIRTHYNDKRTYSTEYDDPFSSCPEPLFPQSHLSLNLSDFLSSAK